jgi:hypothetical protein
MMLRYDGQFGLQHLDRAEFLFARFNTMPMQQFIPPSPCAQPNLQGKGVSGIPDRGNLDELHFYTEVARGNFSFFIDLPYRRAEFTDSRLSGLLGEHACDHSGLDDLNLGTKAMLLDCELLQLTFQFRTYLPTGDPGNGLGTGHTSLEPSLLFALKLTPDCYLQGQFAYWFALGGDPNYQGSLSYNDVSLNKVLCHILPDVELIGTLEASNWNFLDGAYTNVIRLTPDPNNGGTKTPTITRADSTMWAFGPGLRLNVCNRIDVGAGARFWATAERIANEEVRVDLRWRF